MVDTWARVPSSPDAWKEAITRAPPTRSHLTNSPSLPPLQQPIEVKGDLSQAQLSMGRLTGPSDRSTHADLQDQSGKGHFGDYFDGERAGNGGAVWPWAGTGQRRAVMRRAPPVAK